MSFTDKAFEVHVDVRAQSITITNNRKMFNTGPLEVDVDDIDDLLSSIGNAIGETICRSEPTQEVVLMVEWLRGLIDTHADPEAIAQLEALADGVLENVYLRNDSNWRQIRDNAPSSTASASAVGAVSMDLDIARKCGLAQVQIARCYDLMTTAWRFEYRKASHEQGLTRQCKACECWTLPEGKCHLCVPRDIGKKCYGCHGTGKWRYGYDYTELGDGDDRRCQRCAGTGRFFGVEQ